jgi:hypothetical protein
MLIARACIIASAVACFAVNIAAAQPVLRDRDGVRPQRERDAARPERDRQEQASARWVQFGCRPIQGNDQAEVKRFRVDVDNRRFSAIRLSAFGSDVRLAEVKVALPNGDIDVVPVSTIAPINAGTSSDPLDLRGRSHEIRDIEIVFGSQSVSSDRKICVEGLAARDGGTEVRNWVQLGCQVVDFGRDLDRIRVQNQGDSFRALRIDVRENAVQVNTFAVRFFGGASQILVQNPPGLEIQRDRRSPRFTLDQGPQRIREIDLFYNSVPSVRGRAVACVEGLRGPPIPVVPPIVPMADIPPPPAGWERFECQSVGAAGAALSVYVGRNRGRFSGVQVQAFQSGVRVEKLDMVLANQRHDRRHAEPFSVSRDGSTPYFFEDNPHHIETIELAFQSRDRRDGSSESATVCLNGRTAPDRPPRNPSGNRPNDRPGPAGQADWKEIGCQLAQTRPDFDVYRVGREEGTFGAIRFVARRGDVLVRSFKVIFENGASEEYTTGGNDDLLLRSGEPSRALDLVGERRIIRRIQMNYRSASDYRDAEVCIFGQLDRSRPEEGSFWRRQTISDQPWRRF